MEPLTKVSFTNLEKILYPELEVKKSQLIEYYIRIAPVMLEFLQNRAVVLNRFPNGIHNEGFYEKDSPSGLPSWVETFNTKDSTAGIELHRLQ